MLNFFLTRLPVYSKFIAGNNLKSSIHVSQMLKKKNVNTIFDFSVESSKNISRNIDEIYKQINVLESSFIALKFSSLGINNESLIFCQKLIDNFYQENSKKNNPNKFLIDAENYVIQPKIYDLSEFKSIGFLKLILFFLENFSTGEASIFCPLFDLAGGCV